MISNNFLLAALTKHCCHWQGSHPPKPGLEEMASHELCLPQAHLIFSRWSFSKNCPCTFKGGKMGCGDSQSRHLFWPHSLFSGHPLPASASKLKYYKLIHFRAQSVLNGALRSTCVCPQPACLEHSLSAPAPKAGGEGAAGSPAWYCRSHEGAHFSLICCGALDARWNLRDEIWAISCFSSFWTVY